MLEAHYIIAALPDQYGSEMKFVDNMESRARQLHEPQAVICEKLSTIALGKTVAEEHDSARTRVRIERIERFAREASVGAEVGIGSSAVGSKRQIDDVTGVSPPPYHWVSVLVRPASVRAPLPT